MRETVPGLFPLSWRLLSLALAGWVILAPAGGQRLANRDTLDKADQRDQGRRPDERTPGLQIDQGQREGGHAGRKFANNGQAGPFAQGEAGRGRWHLRVARVRLRVRRVRLGAFPAQQEVQPAAVRPYCARSRRRDESLFTTDARSRGHIPL